MKKSKEGASQARLCEYTKTKRGCRVKKVLISAIVSIISFIIFVIIFYNVFIYFFYYQFYILHQETKNKETAMKVLKKT